MLEPEEPDELDESDEPPDDADLIQEWREMAAVLREHPELRDSIGLSESDIEKGDATADHIEQLDVEIAAKESELEALRAQRRALLN